MKTILITGVNGFIGSHLARRFISLGHRVKGIVRPTSELSLIDGLELELFFGDITLPQSLRDPTRGSDIVVHVAALASDWGPYRRFYQVNVEGTRNTAGAALQEGVNRFVYIGTTAVHGFGGFADLEESAAMARTPFHYCETKKIAEQWLFNRVRGMEVTSVRPGNVYGPDDHTFIDKYIDALIRGRLAYVDGGRRFTAPTYIQNLVDGTVAACLEPKAAGEAFFITDGLDITWRAFTERFADELGVRPPKLSVPYPAAYTLGYLAEKLYRVAGSSSPPAITRYRACNAGRDYHFSIEKAGRLLGYSPAVDFDASVARTVHWYREKYGEG